VIITGELEQNRVTGTVIPAIFLGVAAFLLSMVLSRLVGTQRGEIAVLKAFGYSDREVGQHYFGFAVVPVLLGAALGVLGGAWAGGGLVSVYGDFFRFPELEYRTRWPVVGVAVGVSLVAAAVGAFGSVRRAVRLPPAEAMRPELPERFRPGPLERWGLGRVLSAAGRMIVRNVERRPLRSAGSTVGVALSVSLLIVGLAFFDAIQVMTRVQFDWIQREDLAVNFIGPRGAEVLHDLRRLEGVTRAEIHRMVPIRIVHRQRERTVVLTGMKADTTLRRIVDRHGREHRVPPRGLLITSALGRALGIGEGDVVRVRTLEGARVETEVEVVGLVEELFGFSVYMDFSALHALLGESPSATGAWLAVDQEHLTGIYDRLKRLPVISSVAMPSVVRASFEQQVADSLLVSIGFLVILAAVLTVGIVYNGARIALSERGRELASLRVLGFTRREVTVLLLGEQGVLTGIGLPLGWLTGLGITAALMPAFDTEQFRIPVAVSGQSLLISGGATAISALLAGLAVRRRLHRLDLIEVLKTRE
jgi:putative ABC transport system permease protein